MAKKAKSKITVEDLAVQISVLDQVTSALNTAVVALAYAMKVKGNELDKVTSEKYVEFVSEHVHPLVRRADELVLETAKKAVEEVKKNTGETEEK